MSKKIEPSLESITVRGKYEIPETDFDVVYDKVMEELQLWNWRELPKIGKSMTLMKWGKPPKEAQEPQEAGKTWQKYIRTIRSGVPVYFSIIVVEHYKESILVEVECHPAMWHIIAYMSGMEASFTENDVQEALSECKKFVKQVMSIFKGKEIEPVSVYPIIRRAEIKSRLINLGLKRIVDLLDRAERHIVQSNFEASLMSSRTAFEKMVDWQMKKRGLGKTSSYRNDLDRLRSKGYLDLETAELLKSYYRCLSNIGVHEKTKIPVGLFEAQMGYGTTLIMLQYFANKLP